MYICVKFAVSEYYFYISPWSLIEILVDDFFVRLPHVFMSLGRGRIDIVSKENF